MNPIYERLYALAAASEPAAAAELRECADAARDMLEALKRISVFSEGNMNDYPSEYEEQTLDLARAAIAKAEGRADG